MSRRLARQARVAGFVAIGLFFGLSIAAAPRAAEVSFAGKKVEMVIAAAGGQTDDLAARLLGAFLVKHLPGQPTIGFRNMTGNQGAQAVSHVFARVRPDGLGILAGSRPHIDPGAQKTGAGSYDPLKFAYVGGFSRGGTVMVLRKDAMPRLRDRTKPPVIVPGIGAASPLPPMALWGIEYLGWNVKFTKAYAGAPQAFTALRDGDADMLALSDSAPIKAAIEDEQTIPYLQFGYLSEQAHYVGRGGLRGVPLFADVMSARLPDDRHEMFMTWLIAQSVDQWFALPPGASRDIAAAYAEAFDKAMEDEDFLEVAHARFGEHFKPLSSKNMAALAKRVASKSAPMHKHLAELRAKHGLPNDESETVK